MKINSKNFLGIGKNLALVTQMGIMILAPIGLCMFVANFLINKFDLGDGVMIIAILLGVSAGFLNIYKIVQGYFKKNTKTKK
ncbi:MAG: AtpZ/AtpI family protein [Proteocatella sp.]